MPAATATPINPCLSAAAVAASPAAFFGRAPHPQARLGCRKTRSRRFSAAEHSVRVSRRLCPGFSVPSRRPSPIHGKEVDAVGEVGWAAAEGYAAVGPPRRRPAMLKPSPIQPVPEATARAITRLSPLWLTKVGRRESGGAQVNDKPSEAARAAGAPDRRGPTRHAVDGAGTALDEDDPDGLLGRDLRPAERQCASMRCCRLVVPALTALVLVAGVSAGPARADPAPDPAVTRALIERQLVRNDPLYVARRDERLERLTPLAARLHELQERGHSLPCSAQILNEARWLLKATGNWGLVDKDIFVLRTTLLDPDQGFALDQQPHDGSWGTCYDAWFKKLDPTVNALNHFAAVDLTPPHPLRFLAPIATADDLVATLEKLRVNDVAATGVDRRDELGATAAFAAELVFKRDLGDLVRRTTPEVRLDGTLYLTAVSGRSRGMRPGQPERDVRPRVCDVDGALGLATAPLPRSDGIEGHPSGMSLHRQGGSAHGGASRRGERHGVSRHRCVEGQAGLRAPGR